jgi:hypothetical protein
VVVSYYTERPFRVIIYAGILLWGSYCGGCGIQFTIGGGWYGVLLLLGAS